jgi:hypothetical protein
MLMRNPNQSVSRRHFVRACALAASAVACPGLVGAAGVRRGQPVKPPDPAEPAIVALPFRNRAAWTDIAPNKERLRTAKAGQYTRITLHHTGTGVITDTAEHRVAVQLDGILGAHLKRGFGDIGYHYLIDYAGRVWEGRSLRYRGAHVSGENEENVGVVLLGNFEKQRPALAQVTSMNQLVGLLRHELRIPAGRVYGHCDLGHTLCPGKALYPRVQMLNQLA